MHLFKVSYRLQAYRCLKCYLLCAREALYLLCDIFIVITITGNSAVACRRYYQLLNNQIRSPFVHLQTTLGTACSMQ